ncbi:MAG: hypothetical protein OCD02_11370 [Spirochaetaceae bacterium]
MKFNLNNKPKIRKKKHEDISLKTFRECVTKLIHKKRFVKSSLDNPRIKMEIDKMKRLREALIKEAIADRDYTTTFPLSEEEEMELIKEAFSM